MRKGSHEDLARMLTDARAGQPTLGAIKRLCTQLRRNHMSADDIGTSEAELDTLENQAYRLEATRLLQRIRSGHLVADSVKSLRAIVAEERMSFLELGTDDEELRSRLVNHYRGEVQQALWHIRHSDLSHASYRRLAGLLVLAEMTTDELDLSSVELRRIRSAESEAQ